MYILLDTNLVIGYYLRRALNHKTAADRIRIIVDSVRTGRSDHFLYIPNFVIAEVFSCFAKYSFGQANRHVQKNGGTIDTRIYNHLCEQFHKDIHNGLVFYQLELNRYHVLGIDLVAPIDHYFKIQKKNKFSTPAGTFDQLLVSMSVHLGHVHGTEKVALLTADRRLAQLVAKCRKPIPKATIDKLKLSRAQDVAGKAFSPAIFPEALNLETCTPAQLAASLGAWPLPVGALRSRYVHDG